MNRNIQAEGSFGDLKQDMQFKRYLSKRTSNVLAESAPIIEFTFENTIKYLRNV